MPTRRSRLEIKLKILQAVTEGVDKPTRIMYAVNMSWDTMVEFVGSLVDKGFLNEIVETEGKRTKKRYKITQKGRDVIAYFEETRKRIDLESLIN